MKKKILITGGTGRFGNHSKNTITKHKLFFPTKKQFNILNINSMVRYFEKIKPDIVIHLAGFSRPMELHDKEINKSINLNIKGTANITMACSQKNIKLIYFSTHYVYPGINGNYNEEDPLKPFNNYAWSKLGGECSVMLYKNSLILRVCMTERPFVHKKAFTNVKTSFLYQDEVVKILFKLLNKKGIINVGGKAQNIYNFAKKENKNIKKIYQNKNSIKIPFDSTMNVKKLKKILKINS